MNNFTLKFLHMCVLSPSNAAVPSAFSEYLATSYVSRAVLLKINKSVRFSASRSLHARKQTTDRIEMNEWLYE